VIGPSTTTIATALGIVRGLCICSRGLASRVDRPYLILVGGRRQRASASMTKRGENLLRIAAGFVIVAAVLAALVMVLA